MTFNHGLKCPRGSPLNYVAAVCMSEGTLYLSNKPYPGMPDIPEFVHPSKNKNAHHLLCP